MAERTTRGGSHPEPLRSGPHMMNTDDIACSICGNEYDAATSPELDSTNLCPDCAMMQRRARQPRNLPARQIDQLAMRAQD